MSELTYRHPKTKRTQTVQDWENVRRATLTRLGWKQVTGKQPEAQEDTEPAETPDTERKTTERIMPEKLSSEGQPPAKNVKRKADKE